MCLKKLPFIELSVGSFQEFDQGDNVKAILSEEHGLEVGDSFEWTCAQFSGTAQVVAVNGRVYTIKKTS